MEVPPKLNFFSVSVWQWDILIDHSPKNKILKLLRLINIKVSIWKMEMDLPPPLTYLHRWKEGQLLRRAYGVKVWCYWENFGEHTLRTSLETLEKHTENLFLKSTFSPPSQKQDPGPLGCMLHWQSRISIPTYVCHQIFHLCYIQLRGLIILWSFWKLMLNLAQVP